MRNKFFFFGAAAALIMALVLNDGGDAQPPGKKGGKKGGPFGREVTADQIVERIRAFDKNNDGKVSLEELPERMQHLIALGDINKDGVLDKDEIRKLATTLESFASLTGGGGPPNGGPKGGGFGGGGFGKGGPKGAAGEVQRALDDLNLAAATRDKADRAVKASANRMKKFDEVTRAELMLQMKDILNEEDYRSVKASLDREPGAPKKGPKGPPPDLTAKIDQLQKELDDLRRKVAK